MNGSKIQATPNGPYLVHNSPPLKNSKGGVLETRDVTALCRCGKSDNKPYCDGSHAKVGFSSEREADGSNDKWDVYVGKAITLHDNHHIGSQNPFTHIDDGAALHHKPPRRALLRIGLLGRSDVAADNDQD